MAVVIAASTFQLHAKECYQAQNAPNLSGILNELVEFLKSPEMISLSTNMRAMHPITIAYLDKFNSLAGIQGGTDGNRTWDAMGAVHNLSEGKDVEWTF